MALLEVLSLHVGPAVAKAILKHWLKEPGLFNAVGSAAGGGFIDVLKHKTSNILALRHGSNQFEAIGNNVAAHLSRIIEQDGGHIEEGEREAVALKVAETIERAEVNAELLVKSDLNPAALRNQLLQDVSTASRDFSADGTQLYRDIMCFQRCPSLQPSETHTGILVIGIRVWCCYC